MFGPPPTVLAFPLAIVLLAGLLGLLVGSFIGAAACRLPRGEGVVTGRSHCDGCGRTLSPVQLVPVLSFLVQRGRCRACGAPIDRVQPIAEIGGALIAMIAAIFSPDWMMLLLTMVFCWQLWLLALLDIRDFWLPRGLVALLAISAVLPFLDGGPSIDGALWQVAGGALGFVLTAAPALFYRRVRGVEGMGAADPWLLAAIGLWLGPFGVVFTLLAGAGGGLLLAIAAAVSGRPIAPDTAFPLGAFLALAAIAVRLAAPVL